MAHVLPAGPDGCVGGVKHCHKIPSSCHILLDHPPLSQHWHHQVSYFPRPVGGTSWWRHTCMFPYLNDIFDKSIKHILHIIYNIFGCVSALGNWPILIVQPTIGTRSPDDNYTENIIQIYKYEYIFSQWKNLHLPLVLAVNARLSLNACRGLQIG